MKVIDKAGFLISAGATIANIVNAGYQCEFGETLAGVISAFAAIAFAAISFAFLNNGGKQ